MSIRGHVHRSSVEIRQIPSWEYDYIVQAEADKKGADSTIWKQSRELAQVNRYRPRLQQLMSEDAARETSDRIVETRASTDEEDQKRVRCWGSKGLM